MRNDIKQRFLCEFGASLERVWRISKLTPNSQRNLCLMSFFKKNDFKKKKKGKNEFGESPNSLQTPKKNACTTFFECFLSGCTHIFFKAVHAYIFFKFGESLEGVWRFSKLSFSSFSQKKTIVVEK